MKIIKIFTLLTVILFASFLSLFYNYKTFAEEVENYDTLKCGREIPSGEAMELTWEFLMEVNEKIEEVKEYAISMGAAQRRMNNLALQCDIENCTPSCSWDYDEEDYWCVSDNCSGDPCPLEEIEEEFNKVEEMKEKIEVTEEEIYSLIDGFFNENTESVTLKTNEDIRRVGEMGNITRHELIGRKTSLSRDDFDDCQMTKISMEAMERGEVTGKYSFTCPLVIKEDYPRYTKTEEDIDGKKIPLCTSNFNWFCCYDESSFE